jgi:hexokinase
MSIGIFSHFFALETTLAERQFFRALAKLIGRRAARFSACGIAAIVSKMGYLDEGCSVGADGSLYNVRAPPSAAGGADTRRTEIPGLCGPRARGPVRHLRRQGPVSGRRSWRRTACLIARPETL